MKVSRLSLSNFKRFREADFALGEGINVVKGPNESGKSTLMQALFAALFWKVDSRSREVRECATWGGNEGFMLELEGEAGGEPFQLTKDFSNRKVFLRFSGEEIKDAGKVEQRIMDWLGVGSEAAFRSTAGIRQDEVSNIADGRKELSVSLQTTMTGSERGRNAVEAREAMNRELSELLKGTRGPAKNPGPLAVIEEEMVRQQDLRDRLRESVEERMKARLRLEEIEREAASLAARLETLESLAEDSTERADIEEDIEDFHRRYHLLESAASLIKEDGELQEMERERYASLKEVLEGRREELGELELRRAGISESLAVLQRRLDEEMNPRYAAWAPFAAMLGVTLVLVGLAGIALSPYMLFSSLAGAALVAAALFPGGYLRFLRRGGDYKVLKGQAEELERREREIAGSMERIIAEAGCDSVDRFNQLKLGYFELLARRKEIAGKLDVLAPDGNIEGVEQEALRLANEVSIRERRLKELRGRTVEPRKLQEVLKEKEAVRARLERLKEERIRLEVLTREDGVEEDLLRVEEELEYLQERRARLRRKAEALKLALEWLERASSETLASTAGRLGERIGELMGRITEGRYGKVRVGEGDFSLWVWSPEKGDYLSPEMLSRGTVDQIYLAARLALVEIICDDRRPPLLLDDPFVTFDARRLGKAMEVLRELYRRQQVIIFTCGDQYDGYADRVVELRAGLSA
jgi:DNA repair exonuclease SbcCD ATPase subunit